MGGINLLVNCAGVIGAGRVLGKNGPMAGDFFAKVVHINLIGTFLCDKAAAAIMQTNAPTPMVNAASSFIPRRSPRSKARSARPRTRATKAAVAGDDAADCARAGACSASA